MVRYLLLALLASSLFAANLSEKIESYLGKKEFYIQKNLIDILFSNENEYLKENSQELDDVKVLAKLKQNGLLKLFYKDPIDMTILFETKGNALIFMRVVNESLEALGYSYFLTDTVKKEDENFAWSIKLSTEHVVDPLLLSKELVARGCSVEAIVKKSEKEWTYTIDSSTIKIDAEKLEPNTTVTLKKPIRAYWIDLSDISKISIRSKAADRWHPKVVFYDKSLKVVSYYTRDDVINFVKLDVPLESKYVKIEDVYTLDNIKRGLSLYLHSQN